ncbi:hypothetical protein D3C78_1955080 [compost metagenome]
MSLRVVVTLLFDRAKGPAVQEMRDQRADDPEQPLDERPTCGVTRGLANNGHADGLSARDEVVG